jgi:diacylglycerol kinase
MCVIVRVSGVEYMIVLLCSTIVMALEMINTSIELICDFMEPEKNPKIKEIKDISAGAVLLFTVTSYLIGCLIFIPKLVMLIYSM